MGEEWKKMRKTVGEWKQKKGLECPILTRVK
jgi:hypothetical protein